MQALAERLEEIFKDSWLLVTSNLSFGRTRLLRSVMSDLPEWELEIEGDFPVHKAVVAVMPNETKVISAESCGISAWTKTAKLTVILPDQTLKRYFLKVSHLKYI